MSDINAVEMTRRIRDAHFEQLQGKTPEEAMAFFREKAERVHALLRKATVTSPKA